MGTGLYLPPRRPVTLHCNGWKVLGNAWDLGTWGRQGEGRELVRDGCSEAGDWGGESGEGVLEEFMRWGRM